MIRLIRCGYNYIHQNGITIDRPNGSGVYAFVFFRSNAEALLNGNLVPVEKNSFILFRPETKYLYRDREKPFINDWFNCEGDCLQDFLLRLCFPVDTIRRAADPFLITKCIMDLQNTAGQNGPLRDEIIDADLRSFFMKLINFRETEGRSEKASSYRHQFSALRNQLYSSPQTHLSIEALASRVNMSKSYFQHIYKELFGCSVTSDMINGRLDYARYLLENSSFTVSAVCNMCGYVNEAHFIRQFKKSVGTTPGRYRAEHR